MTPPEITLHPFTVAEIAAADLIRARIGWNQTGVFKLSWDADGARRRATGTARGRAYSALGRHVGVPTPLELRRHVGVPTPL
jgi:hypothetical protein